MNRVYKESATIKSNQNRQNCRKRNQNNKIHIKTIYIRLLLWSKVVINNTNYNNTINNKESSLLLELLFPNSSRKYFRYNH